MNKIKYFETEINYIKDRNRREDIKYLIGLLPDYFFKIPASSTGKYHPKFASTEHGLLKHTKVAVRIAYDLFQINDMFSDSEKDLIIMALIMHDGLKKGMEEEEYTRFDHPLLASKLIMEHAKKYPNMSLGVATLNIKQKSLIENEIEKLREEDSSCEEFFNDNKQEYFFVKNFSY